MTQTLTMRATSLAASTALLALAGFAALTFSWTVSRFTPPPDGPVIISEQEPVAPRSHPVRYVRPPESAQYAAEAAELVNTAPVSAASASEGLAVPDLDPPTIDNAHWLRTPHNLARYYPVMALRREIEGEVQLDCLVATTGELQCVVTSETPASWGFGAAAIRISHDYRMVPATHNGAPVEARYRMRAPFRLNR